MLNQSNAYSLVNKLNYSKYKNYPSNNLNVSNTYQDSPSQFILDGSSKVSFFDPNKSKEINSPYKPKFNLENETPGEKQISFKNRFEDLKKKYEQKDKPENFSFQLINPLKESQKNNLEISFNKNSDKKTGGFNVSTSETKNPPKEKVNQFNQSYQQKIATLNNNYLKNKSYLVNQTSNKISSINQETRINLQPKIKVQQEKNQQLDKITQKIQKIMKCIQQNQKAPDQKITKLNTTFAPKYMAGNNRKISIGQTDNNFDKDKIKNQIKEKVSEYAATPFTNNLPQNPVSNQLVKQQSSATNNKIQRKSVIESTNNRITSSNPAKSTGSQRTTLSNGKDVDQQIRKINDRIRKSEEQKRKLNIKFEDFKEYPGRNKTIETKPNKMQKFDEKSVEKMRTDVKKILRQDYKKQQITPNKISNFLIEKTQAKLTKKIIDQKQSKPSKLQYPSHTSANKRSQQDSKLSNIQEFSINSIKIQVKRLIDCFKHQVNLDESLRDGKLIFSMSDDPQKWTKLKSQIQKNGNINMSDTEVKEEFEITLEQHDPFFSVRQQTQNSAIQSLAKKYKEAQNYFNNNIKKKFNSEKLARENFKQQNWDLQRKGYLTVEDFVRYLNMQTGTFYRNRDLILIFRRLSSGTELKFVDFIKLLCQ